jgi:hypothetical protein
MPYNDSVTNKQGDVFLIEGPYTLNYNKSKIFSYINKVTLWTDGTCVATSHIPINNNNRLF